MFCHSRTGFAFGGDSFGFIDSPASGGGDGCRRTILAWIEIRLYL
jgi:hypothetical protein